MKHGNTTSREKKDVQNFVFRYKETQSFKKQKYVWQYIQKKKPNQNLAVIYINTGYWGVFTNELSRKEKKKRKKIQSQESYKYDVLEK